MTTGSAMPFWFRPTPAQRRVMGVLIEGQKIGKEYPMTPHAIMKGANQKWKHTPPANYDIDKVEETLRQLQSARAAECHEGSKMRMVAGQRADRWRHTLYDRLGLRNRPIEMAILACLMLNRTQTITELRSMAATMDKLPQDIEDFRAKVLFLCEHDLAVRHSLNGSE